MKSVFILVPNIGVSLSALVLASHITARGDRVTLVAGRSLIENLEQIQLNCNWIELATPDELVDLLEKSQTEVCEIVAWDHQQGMVLAVDAFSAPLMNLGNRKCGLSIYTDGFNWGERQSVHEELHTLLRVHNSAIHLEISYSFFATRSGDSVNQLKSEVVGSCHLRHVVGALASRDDVKDSMLRMLDEFPLIRQVGLVIMLARPWCSNFHDANYNFGKGAESLARILIGTRIAAIKPGLVSVPTLVKTDYRLHELQRDAVHRMHGEEAFEFIWSENVPEVCKSAEVLVSALIELLNSACQLTIISLDSSAPLSLSLLEGNMTLVVGAPEELLKNEGALPQHLSYIAKNSKWVYEATAFQLSDEESLVSAQSEVDGFYVLVRSKGNHE